MDKTERLVDKAQLEVRPYVVAHNKEVKLTQLKIDEDRSKGHVRTLDKERVKSIYEGLKTTIDELEVKQILLLAADPVGMPLSVMSLFLEMLIAFTASASASSSVIPSRQSESSALIAYSVPEPVTAYFLFCIRSPKGVIS